MTGADLFAAANNRLLGYGNAIPQAALLDYLNEGKDEVWTLLKTLSQDYFGQTSQDSDPTQLNYFADLQPTQRSFTLPADFEAIRFIEPTTPDMEQVVFKYANLESPEFQTARRAANVDKTLTPTVEYWYTIFGKNQMILAVFPQQVTAVTLYYIRRLIDIVYFTTGTATITVGTNTVSLNGTTYSQAQMNTMLQSYASGGGGAHFIVNGLDFGPITSVNPGTQQLTLLNNAPSTQTTQPYAITAVIDEVLDPFNKKISDFAVKKALLSAQAEEWTKWREEWQADLRTLTTGAAPRNQADAQFVQDFTG